MPFSHTPQAFLYGYVQTLTAGYRQITIGGTTYTVAATAADGSVFPDFITALNTAISGSGWGAAINSNGSVTLSGSAAAVSFPDSLGLLLGLPYPPGNSAGTVTSLTSSSVAAPCLPLYGATWTEIEIERTVEYEVTRFARTHGYVYGGARVYSWELVMDRDTLQALRFGWCSRTRIRIEGKATGATGTASNAISSSNPAGYLDGYPLGIQNVEWLDGVQQVAKVRLLVVGGSA
tara:strand:- start:2247 stop:2948 length:702 start_codon:yes stop_codon:yes gene_type:complete